MLWGRQLTNTMRKLIRFTVENSKTMCSMQNKAFINHGLPWRRQLLIGDKWVSQGQLCTIYYRLTVLELFMQILPRLFLDIGAAERYSTTNWGLCSRPKSREDWKRCSSCWQEERKAGRKSNSLPPQKNKHFLLKKVKYQEIPPREINVNMK